MENKTDVRTLEQRILEKFDKMQVCRENRDQEGAGELFDELSRSVELLMTGLKEANAFFSEKKKSIDSAFKEEQKKIESKLKSAQDDISRQIIWNTELVKLLWEYRDILESLTMETINKFGLVERKNI